MARPPVDILNLVRTLGIQVYLAPNMGRALSALERKGPTIWLNSQDNVERQRFGIAHQLGHLLLHPPADIYRDVTYAWDSKTDPKEREASEFASHLLMPLWILEPWVVGSTYSTEEFAQMFGVSLGAMRWQLSKLL